MATNFADIIDFFTRRRRSASQTQAVPNYGAQANSFEAEGDLVGNNSLDNSLLGANSVPASSLSFDGVPNSVDRRYKMGRAGVYTAEAVSEPSGLTKPFVNSTNPVGASPTVVGGGVLGTGFPSSNRPDGANGANDDGLDSRLSEYDKLTASQPKFTPEAEPNPEQFRRKGWKDILFGMAASVANLDPNVAKSPGGLIGALVGGSLGGKFLKNKVKDAQGKEVELGAYGMSEYQSELDSTRQRNEQKFSRYKAQAAEHDKRVDAVKGGIQLSNTIENSRSMRTARETTTERLGEQAKFNQKLTRDKYVLSVSNSEHQKKVDEAKLQASANRESLKKVVHPESGDTVLARFSPDGKFKGYASDERGRILEAPDTGFDLFTIRNEQEKAESQVPAPDDTKLRAEAEAEVRAAKDFGDLTPAEQQARISSVYAAKKSAAEKRFEQEKKKARTNVVPSRSRGGAAAPPRKGAPTTSWSAWDALKKSKGRPVEIK